MSDAIIDIPFTLNRIEAMVWSYARFVFRAERRERVWRLFGFDAVYQRDEIMPRIPGQTVTASIP